MKLYLYNTSDDEIVLNKTLENKKEIEIDFKASCNRLDTQIILNYKKGNFDPNAYNYVRMDIGYIKYFFITNKEFIDNENVVYSLHQDVYMSNQTTIKTRIYGVLDRSGSKFNRYINDENLVLTNQKRVQTKKFSKSFKPNNNAILIVTSD
jgi:hypothetical protein